MVRRTVVGGLVFAALLAMGVLVSDKQAAARHGCHGGLLSGRCDGKGGLVGRRCDGILAGRCHGRKADGLLGRRWDGGKCHGGLLGRRCHGGGAGGKVEEESAPPVAPESPPAPPAPPATSASIDGAPAGYIPVAFRR